eukprot:NODE_631_length_5776_cov_0.697199.p3 type:complete len:221 gc:universal NODE_631_length_5776_cov_0.697199:5440-4778(-)
MKLRCEPLLYLVELFREFLRIKRNPMLRRSLSRMLKNAAEKSEAKQAINVDKPIDLEEFKVDELKTKVDVLKSQLEELDKKHALLLESYQKSKIELKDMQYRHQKEIEKTKDFGAQHFAKDLFIVHDTLTNAQRFSKNTTGKENEGFEMIRKQIVNVFKNHHLHLIDPKEGDPFHHDVHEAIYQMDHDHLKDGQIGKVEQVGFQLKDRVLRAAQVGVVKK